MTKILVVDDNQQNLYMLQVLLSANSFEVELAANGAEALEQARRAPPDLVISDILMPVMDGFALCRAWKKDKQLKKIPFIFYTANYTDPRDEDFALNLGAERFIVKPVEPDKFLALLRETIETHKASKLAAPREPVGEAEYYKEYNATLTRKLEDKILQLEEKNRALELDATIRRQAEEKNAQLAAIVASSDDAIIGKTLDGIITSWNKGAERIYGYTESEMIGKPVSILVPPGSEDEILQILERVKSGEHIAHYETVRRRKDGQDISVSIAVSPIRDTEGKIIAASTIGRDITERKRAEEEVQDAQAELQRLLAETEQSRRALLSILEDRKQAEEAVERKSEELRQSNEELARLYRASGSLLSSAPLGLHELAQRIVEIVQKEFGQANCSLLILQRDSKVLQRLAVAGPYADQVKDKTLTLDGPGLVPQAIRTGKTINMGNVQSVPRYEPNWQAARSEMTVPLKIGNEVIGVLDTQSAQLDAFNLNDERLMSVFAERVALALEHSRLYEQTETRVQQLAALRTIDMAISSSFDIDLTLGILLENLKTQLGIHAADILKYDLVTQTFQFSCGLGFHTNALQHTHLRIGEGLAGKVALERRLLKVPDLRIEPAGFGKSPLLLGENFVAFIGVPLIAKGQIKGVLEVFQREPLELNSDQQAFLEMLASQAGIAIDNAELFEHQQKSIADLNSAYNSTLEGWARALELRDKETEGHTRRVMEQTVRLARVMGVKEDYLVHIYRGALLHDIGKIGVPDGIVLKPGPLTEEEWIIMRKHPVYAYELLLPIAHLREALNIPYCHHEKWDGTGYPRGLKGLEIPLAARIFSVVDVWDALTSDRPYRKAWSQEKARTYIHEQAGRHFDPEVVEIFIKEQNLA